MKHPLDELEDSGIGHIVELGIDMALRTGDPDRLRSVLESSLPMYLEETLDDRVDAQHAWRPLATELSRTIWNVTPLPDHDFSPRPLPRPGRNSPCPCGSGTKYKQCCGRANLLPLTLTQEQGWLFALRCLSRKNIEAAIERRRVPIGVLAEHASWLLENAEPANIPPLLKPLFAGERLAGTADHAYAFDVLLDAYDALGKERAKRRLVDEVIAKSPRGVLRSGAAQRLAAIRMDEGDRRGAWEAFEAASRDDPNSASLSHLEVQLLVAQNEPERARERARYWIRRFEKLGRAEYEQIITFLRGFAEDPSGALADVYIDGRGGAGAALREWLDRIAGRPVPQYELTAVDDFIGDDVMEPAERLSDRLGRMGLAGLDPAQLEERLSRAVDAAGAEGEVSPDPEPTLEHAHTIQPPPSLVRMEGAWREVFLLDKPFSTHSLPFSGAFDPWEESSESMWSDFLEDHPEAFDSLDVLDDLATAVCVHDSYGAAALDTVLMMPILERALAIVEKATGGASDAILPWGFPENRPALRAMERLIGGRLESGDDSGGQWLAGRLLALNPNDNHGTRALIVCADLQYGRDDAALALCDRFPGDTLAEIAFGRVLALYRLGRVEEATDSLRSAVERHPPLARILTAKRAPRINLDPSGYILGSDQEAAGYRETMRETWAETPGALEWLRRSARKLSK